MERLIKKVASFPNDYPQITTGTMFDDKTLITGHQNGFVVRWDLEKGDPSVIFSSNSPVNAISCLEKRIAVGYFSGGLYLLEPTDKGFINKELRKPKNTVNSRIWRLAWINSSNLLLTSTYGEISSFRYNSGSWTESYFALKGHSHSIFGISSINGKYIATGDYLGVVILWKFENEEYRIIQKFGVLGTIQDLFWQNEERLAIITKSGRMYVVEKERKDHEKWQTVLEVNIAEDRGVSVEIANDGKLVYGGTLNRLIKFDLDSYQFETSKMNGVKSILPAGKYSLILDIDGLYVIENRPVTIVANLISYKFIKISLLGYTGTGKTSFCSNLVNGSIDNIYSTFGKRIFSWKVGQKTVEEKIFFHDHGGQETTLETFIPQVMDSDIILIFYRKTDNGTFNKAVEILKQIRKKTGENIPIFFVETFIDHLLDDISEGSREELLRNKKISGIVKVSPKTNAGFEIFEKDVLGKIDWDKARNMVQTPYIQGISIALALMVEKNYDVVLFDVFKQTYEEQVIGEKISERHLKFLLEDYTNQGIIQYYPQISDLIILDDKKFKKMQTDVPKFVAQKGGIVTTEELLENFENEDYLRILDEMYCQSGVSIRNGQNRLFPRLLSDSVSIDKKYAIELAKQEKQIIYVNSQDIEINRLLEQLSELGLQAVNLAKKEGLFSWENNAYIHYFFQEDRTGIDEKYIRFTYSLGGSKPTAIERLRKDFTAIIERAYGPIVKRVIASENNKKKVDIEYDFDVALSFAGEERKYVEELANILKGKGIRVFYDKFEKSQLWGKNLVEYFKEVYYSKSKFCIMFISSAYLQKMWPAHERKNATARDLEAFGEYILPIIFEDNLNVPGLDKYRGHLDARQNSPSDVAITFTEKLEAEEKKLNKYPVT